MSGVGSMTMAALDWSLLAEFVAGGLVIIAAGQARFGTPASARSGTTAFRYYSSLVVYVTLGVALYTGLAWLVDAEIQARAAASLSAPAAWWPARSSPVAVAIALLLLASLPAVARADRWARARLLGVFGGTGAARRLASYVQASELRPAPELEARVKATLARRGYDADARWLAAAEPMQAQWMRAALLFEQVRGWAADPGYRAFVSEAEAEHDALRQHFDLLSLKVVRVLRTVDGVAELWAAIDSRGAGGRAPGAGTGPAGPAPAQAAARAIVTHLLTDLQEDITFFLRSLCLFVARGVLGSASTSAGRRRRLERLGFAPPERERPAAAVLAWAFAAYVCVFVVFMLGPALVLRDAGGGPAGGSTSATMGRTGEEVVAETGRRSAGPGRLLIRIAMIATIQVLALALAVVPKRHLGFASEDLHGRTPREFIVAAGLGAGLVSAAVQHLFLRVEAGSWATAHARFLEASHPWALMAVTTAALTAFLVQDSRWAGTPSPTRRRLKDSLSLGLGMTLAVLVVWWWLHALGAFPPRRALGVAPLLWLEIGWMVPSAFRRPPAAPVAPRFASMASRLERRTHRTRLAVSGGDAPAGGAPR